MMMSIFVAMMVSLGGAVVPAVGGQAPSAAQESASAKVPDTPAGKALDEFVATFNAGGEKRKAWLASRTTVNQEQAANILKQDTDFLSEHGPVTVVKLPQASAHSIQAIIRHAKTGVHGHLTITVDAETPHKVATMQLRGATAEEIKGQ